MLLYNDSVDIDGKLHEIKKNQITINEEGWSATTAAVAMTIFLCFRWFECITRI